MTFLFPRLTVVLCLALLGCSGTARQDLYEKPTTQERPMAGERPVVAPAPEAPAVGPEPAAPLPEALRVIDDFEGEPAWDVEDWGNAARTSVVERYAGRWLRVDLAGGRLDKSALTLRLDEADFSESEVVHVDVDNETGQPLSMALSITTGAEGAYFESEPRTLPPGLSRRVAFPLKDATFKSAASNWAHTAAPGHLSSVQTLGLLFYTQAKGTVFLDNLSAD